MVMNKKNLVANRLLRKISLSMIVREFVLSIEPLLVSIGSIKGRRVIIPSTTLVTVQH